MNGTLIHPGNPRFFIDGDNLWSVATTGEAVEVHCGPVDGELALVATLNAPPKVIRTVAGGLEFGPVPRIVVSPDGTRKDDSADWGDEVPTCLAPETTDEHGRIVLVWNGRRYQPIDVGTKEELPPVEGFGVSDMDRLVGVNGQLRGLFHEGDYWVWDRENGGQWRDLRSQVWNVRRYLAVGKSIVARAKTRAGESIVRVQGKGTVTTLLTLPQLSGLELTALGRRGVAFEDDGVVRAVGLNGDVIDIAPYGAGGGHRPHHSDGRRLVCMQYAWEPGPHGMSVQRDIGPRVFDLPADFNRS